ncbi:protein regulator of cytokinesis 1-like [Lutzomyia longipalpis]|uniref:protein regulator of cytokinesis 1-like n=1 Tax=Lutzomyia longipalpis TaxID=7200 RepID=UPI0024841072|nr:protein regulator of cytokinesis 1-like [Lutzomyia longipalpis]
MDNYCQVQEQVEAEIAKITHESLSSLKSLWDETFEKEICEENVRIMVDHVRAFYDEIIEETKSRKAVILSDIQKLHEEASTIRRLLHVDFELSPKKGLPLHNLRAHLDESLKALRGQLKRRKEEITELLVEQESLCQELGEECRDLVEDPLPTAEDLEEFRRHLGTLKGIKQERIAQVLQLRKEIKLNLMTLEITLTSESDLALLTGHKLPIKKNNLRQLQEMKEEFDGLCRDLSSHIETMQKKLVILWDYLEVDDEVRQYFSKFTEICQTTHDKLRAELDRCETMKKQNIKKIVDKIREEIVHWWDKTLKSDLEISRFSNFTSELYTEDLLSLHEIELERLKIFYANNERIFDLIEERRLLWEQMLALEKSASNPNRFNNRGGQLLREEKERKKVASKLPKIEAQLVELVQKYEATEGKKFMMRGQFVEDVIANDHEKRKQEKEKVMSARKMVKGATPLMGNSRLLTPMPNRTNATGYLSTVIRQKAKTTGAKPAPSVKRKMGPHPEESLAKRSILKDLASPNVFVKPRTVKKVTKPPKIVATMHMAGKRRSSGRHRRLSGRNRSRGSIPKIRESSTDSDSTSYEFFETYLDGRSPCRSSMMLKPPVENDKLNPDTPHCSKLPPTRTPASGDQKSIVSRANTPSPSKKLSTKNLPLII